MLGCIQPMSSPMMNKILGFCWAVATPANSGMAARTATTVHIRSIATTALVFIHYLLSLDPHYEGPSTSRALVLCRRGGAIPACFILFRVFLRCLLMISHLLWPTLGLCSPVPGLIVPSHQLMAGTQW